VEELSGYDFEELVDYCTDVLELKPIPDEGLLALVELSVTHLPALPPSPLP
jgi:hypothetical protein